MTESGLQCRLSVTSGNVSREIKIVFGDIWLCSGQSNILFSMKEVVNSKQEIKEGKQLTFEGGWTEI